jgi:hypothetical protein
MKKLASIVSLFVLSITVALAGEGKFFSQVIHDTDQPFRLSLPANKAMKVLNFIQSGVPGPVINLGAIAVYQGTPGLSGIFVLQADFSSNNHVVHEDVFIAGPAVVYISPIAGETLFLSYLLANN